MLIVLDAIFVKFLLQHFYLNNWKHFLTECPLINVADLLSCYLKEDFGATEKSGKPLIYLEDKAMKINVLNVIH